MAKRQKYMRSILCKNLQTDETPLIQISSSSEGVTFRPGLIPLEIVVSQWKDAWYSKFDWIEFDTLADMIFYKIYRQKNDISIFASMGSINIRISTFQYHRKNAKHKCLTWAMQKEEQTMKRGIAEANWTCDEIMHSLFQTIYYIR